MVSFPQASPPTPCTYLSPIRATCPALLILLDFTTRTIFGKKYRSLSSSLCNFLHSRYLVLLGPNTLLDTKHYSSYLQLMCTFQSAFSCNSLAATYVPSTLNTALNMHLSHFHHQDGKGSLCTVWIYVNSQCNNFMLGP
jgi:hypothetical protein